MSSERYIKSHAKAAASCGRNVRVAGFEVKKLRRLLVGEKEHILSVTNSIYFHWVQQ
jgi:hypothetical protein